MSSKNTSIGVVEAAYAFDETTEEWLSRILDVAAPEIDGGLGTLAYTFQLTRGALDVTSDIVMRGDCAPETPRFVAELATTSSRGELEATYGTAQSHISLSEACDRIGIDLATWPSWAEQRSLGIMDVDAIKVVDPTGSGCLIGVPRPDIRRVPKESDARWASVMVHVAAALRLRRELGTTSLLEGAAAILESSGECAEASDEAKSRASREALRGAVKQIDRARAGLRERPMEALELWRGLVAGRWSLVDHFDSDGRRYVVARRNAPHVKDPRALTERERQVVSYLGMGYASKYIAYALGLSSATISRAITSTCKKLGASSRTDLVRLARRVSLGVDDQVEPSP